MNPNANKNLKEVSVMQRGEAVRSTVAHGNRAKLAADQGMSRPKTEKLLLLVRHNINRLIVESAST